MVWRGVAEHAIWRRGAAAGAVLALVAGLGVAMQVVSAPPASAVSTSPTTIAAGTSHSCMITNGDAYCWGDNTNGELGNGSTISSDTPVAVFTGGVLAGVNLIQITVGTNFTCALGSTGTPYCWGLGTSGQLGNNLATTSDRPVTVSGSLNLTQITAGDAFACGATSAGVASCWGLGTNGQLGNGLGTTSNVPVTVSGSQNLAEIDAGGATVCALTSTNVAYCWGAGASGQLGNGSSTATQSAPTPVTVSAALTGVTLNQITVGTGFACALAGSTGRAYCWGSNASDQLGTATTPNNVPVAVTTTGTPPLSGVTLTQISAGGSTTCALAGGTGLAYCWGAGGSGQLGNGTTTNPQPTAVAVTATGVLSGVTLTQISAGANFACAVASKGAANCWGANSSGQLGNPATAAAATVFDVPAAVTSEPDNIEAGYLNACMLRNGKAYCWGDDGYGELGNNLGTGQYSTPQAVLTSGVLSGLTLTQIASANNFTCTLSSAGNAYCWGPGSSGQLGNGLATASNAPVAVTMGGSTFTQITTGTNFACALTTAGNAYCWGADSNGQMGNTSATSPQKTPIAVTMPGSTTFTQITAGNGYACALTSTGGAYCWGLGTTGQLGQNTAASSTTPVAVTLSAGVALAQISAANWTSTTGSSCAVSSKGAAYCWGLNSSGQLGDNTTTQRNLPTAVYTACGSPCSALNGKTVTQVTVGGAFACALDNTGAAYCWGLGTGDQLGNNAAASSNFPVAVYTGGVLAGVQLAQISSGQLATCAQDTTGDFYCWGNNTSGQLGNASTTSSDFAVIVLPYPPTSVTAFPGNTTATVYWVAPGTLGTDTVTNYTVTVSPGGATCTVSTLTCVITGLSNGTTYTVTVVTNTSQGPSATSTAATVTPWPPRTIAAGGRESSCTIYSGKAYCWGDDSDGELGNGVTTATAQLTPVAVYTGGVLAGVTLTQITMGYWHVCALASTGAMYCWGYDVDGELGNGTTGSTPSNVPVLVSGGLTFTQISAGQYSTCAVSSAGAVYCWGLGSDGQLGVSGSTANSSTPVAVTTSGTALSGRTVVQVAAGYVHTCALDSTGLVYCWGVDTNGELGNNTTSSTPQPAATAVYTTGTPMAGRTIVQITAGSNFTCALDSAGLGYCWGYGLNGQLGNNATPTSQSVPVALNAAALVGVTLATISASEFQTCALGSTGVGYCWGYNADGRLGTNNTTTEGVPTTVYTGGVLADRTLAQINAGDQDSCALDSTGTAYCWGTDANGQLGDDTTVNGALSYYTAAVLVGPQAPTGVTATPGDTTAAMSWTTPVYLNDGTVTGYTFTTSPGAFTCTTTGATSCTITGLTDGTTYTVTGVTTTTTVLATTGTSAPSTAATVEPIGILSLTSPTSLTWGAAANGGNESVVDTVAGDQQLTVTDNTATGAGWRVTVSATTFTSGAHTLPNAGALGGAAMDVTGSVTASSSQSTIAPSATCVGSCTLPTIKTGFSYPVEITTASSPSTFTIYDTSAGTGEGVMTIGGSAATNPIGWWVQMPASGYTGTYTSTVTLEVVSGP